MVLEKDGSQMMDLGSAAGRGGFVTGWCLLEEGRRMSAMELSSPAGVGALKSKIDLYNFTSLIPCTSLPIL